MPLAVLEHDGNGSAVPIHADATAFRDVDVRLFRPLDVREKDVEPSFAGAGDFLDVQHDVREVPHVEHPRLHPSPSARFACTRSRISRNR